MGNYDTAIEKLMSYLEQYPADKDAKKNWHFCTPDDAGKAGIL